METALESVTLRRDLCHRVSNLTADLEDLVGQAIHEHADPETIAFLAKLMAASRRLAVDACADPPHGVGGAAGGLAATAAVSAAGAPELAPAVVPIGAAAGEAVERETRRRVPP